jgi:ADP-ribosylglycohydrolase/fructose-1,6-bisphosphatase/inositol monophosphatase family enzyme
LTDLTRALAVATEAALDAGALIRAEFHRADGPRASGGHHADVDNEAEGLIRDRLLSAFPDWAYLGEETRWGGNRNATIGWLIDPNDGTNAFIQGWRGSAVSIALIDRTRGLPVLGVVYAPLAPDDEGDLFSWSEGAPLLRNGRPIQRALLPQSLDSSTVVLLNHHSGRDAEANAKRVAPARFMPVPSIAYRLALVAAGDADAGVSLSAPTGWDVAGGHALLLGAGGDLLDQDGDAIRYPTLHPPVGNVFGGSLPIAKVLSSGRWHSHRTTSVSGSDPASARASDLTGRRISDAGVLRRAQGCLLGQAAGDALGQLVEFLDQKSIDARYPAGVRELADGGAWHTIAGQPTDDTELALALGRSLVAEGGFDAAAVAKSYEAWLASGPFDVGTTTRRGLRGHPDHTSASNGSVMRVSPLGVFGHALPAERVGELAREDSALTHPNPVCRDAAAALAAAIAQAVRHGDGAAAAYQAAVAWAERADAAAEVRQALDGAASVPPEDFQTHMGFAPVALQNAFFEALHAESLEEGVIRTVGRGGDTDTNGAIAGALLGAIHGRDAVPLRWRRAVLTCRALPGTSQPRPAEYWPVDLMQLAERLLIAGSAPLD